MHYVVIEAQIPMPEDLKKKTSIQFPTVTNTSTDVSLVFGSMTPMIEIPSNIILRQLEEGTVIEDIKHVFMDKWICVHNTCVV